MALPLAEKTVPAAPAGEGRRLVRLLLAAAAVLFVAAVALWVKFGSAVFIETMATAWAYCF